MVIYYIEKNSLNSSNLPTIKKAVHRRGGYPRLHPRPQSRHREPLTALGNAGNHKKC